MAVGVRFLGFRFNGVGVRGMLTTQRTTMALNGAT